MVEKVVLGCAWLLIMPWVAILGCRHGIDGGHWRLMQEWRDVKLQGRDMLQQPQPHFEAFKALFSHGVLGFKFSGRPPWVMKVCLSVSVAMLDAFSSDDRAQTCHLQILVSHKRGWCLQVKEIKKVRRL